MQTETTPRNRVTLPAELTDKYAYIGKHALHLRIVEEFLTQMELNLLKTSPANFDIGSVKAGLKELRELDEGASDRRKRIEFQISRELSQWQEHLAERDAQIEAYHIRRYCDGLKNPLDSEVFVALSRFYRNLGYSRPAMSKFDLAMTRAFTSQLGELRRCLVADRETLSARIAAHYAKWDRMPVENHGSHRDVQVFDRYIEECFSIDEFEELTGSKLFDRVREFKSELGDRFFHPNVAAAAIECNIALGNRLNVLMAKAAENLGERLGSEFDFAGALQDTSSNAGAYISDVLREIDKEDGLISTETESEDLFLLRSMLDLAEKAGNQAGEAVAVSTTDDGEEAVSTRRPEFQRILGLIDHQNPDVAALRKGLDEIDEFRSIDFNDFLFCEDGTPDLVSRDVLKKILSLESLRAHELNEKKEISRNVRKEVMGLLSQAEKLGDSLEKSTAAADRLSGARLLFVSNKLLETRLRMERSIVRFSSKNLGLPEHGHPPDKVIENELADNLSYIDTGTMDANRWLIVATVAVAVFFFFVLFNGRTADVAASEANDVETIEPAKLAGGKYLSGAHRQGSTLYAVGTDAWRKMGDEQKTDALKDLLSAPMKKKLETVMVVDDQGNRMADISPEGVDINKEPPAFDTAIND
jgi:hypothetical protein